MDKVKVVIIGSGLRGMYTYAKFIKNNSNICEIVGVVEPKKGRLELFSNEYNIQDKYCFESIEDFFKCEKIADAVIIATKDDMHYELAKIALEIGYEVLLESPLANTLDQIVHLNELSNKYSERTFMVSNELKYTPFFYRLKEIIESKELGQLISIQYNKNIGYFDFIHDHVRGSWRNSSDTSPLILSKGCNDIDILLYLTESACEKISSFGNLNYFNSRYHTEDMSENCFNCKVEESCPYSSKKIYIDKNRNINTAVHINPTKENLTEILQKGPYGRCVYKCDNNVVDNMASILQFENGTTATFNLSAFTKESDINIKLMFSRGEVEGSFINNEIKLRKFGQDEATVIIPCNSSEINNFGINELIKDFVKAIKNKDSSMIKCNVKDSIESHIIAFAAEYSRISDEVIYLKDFFENAVDMTKEIENTLV